MNLNKFEKLVNKLGLEQNLKKIVLNKTHIPILDDYNSINEYWYPYPPCLTPLFLGCDSSYKGIIHHFFCDRKETFIEYNLENGYMSEIARNENQLFTLLILKMIVIKDDLSNEIIDFSKEINYDKIQEINEFSIKYGDNPEHFNELVYYKENTPFIYLKDRSQYNGDYPSSLSILNQDVIKNSCEFEISNKKLLQEVEDIPLWLESKNNKKELFELFVTKNQLKEAWFTLNSKGWLLTDVAKSLKILKNKSNDLLL